LSLDSALHLKPSGHSRHQMPVSIQALVLFNLIKAGARLAPLQTGLVNSGEL